MRLGTLSTVLMILGLSLSACGGESVEDRARALKAAQKPAQQQPAQPAYDPSMPQPMPTATGSSSAYPAPPLPPP
jgi:hypothetical protein